MNLPDRCPKCGWEEVPGRATRGGPVSGMPLWLDPRYGRLEEKEWLQYRCYKCGFSLYLPTLDAKP